MFFQLIRDVEYIINIFMMLMFYLCPIVYDATLIPDKYLRLFKLNPMFHIISFYRDILYYQKMPELNDMLIVFVVCIFVLIFGYFIFKRLKKKFAEEL